MSGFSNNEVNSAQIVHTGRINVNETIINRNNQDVAPNDLTHIERTIQVLKECFKNVKQTSDSFHPSAHCPDSKEENGSVLENVENECKLMRISSHIQ